MLCLGHDEKNKGFVCLLCLLGRRLSLRIRFPFNLRAESESKVPCSISLLRAIFLGKNDPRVVAPSRARQSRAPGAVILCIRNRPCALPRGQYLPVHTRHLTLDGRDPYKCHALLNSGRWLDPDNLRSWQPPSCVLYNYSLTDSQSCFAGRRLVFAGDSMVRETFFGMVRELDPNVHSTILATTEKNSDILLKVNDTDLEFYWDPYLNDTGYDRAFRPAGKAKPALTIVGAGLWHARNLGDDAYKDWEKTISNIVLSGRGGDHTKRHSPSDLLVMLPLSKPDEPQLNEARHAIILETLDRMNAFLEQLSSDKILAVASSFNDMHSTTAPAKSHNPEELYLVPEVASAQAQVLINRRCNDHLPKTFPFDKTCCFKYPRPNYIQLIFFALVLLVLPAMYYFNLTSTPKPIQQALLTFGLVLVLAYFSDRTHVFAKESKQFSLEGFWLLVILTAFLGYFTAQSSEKDHQTFLNRNQTDEWKGWMQFFILIYYYLGASKISWISNFIRVIVAMYLFMTGFGHTVFFYTKADFGLRRGVAVVLRLNLLNVALSYSMDTDYLFYYFPALVTFWFGVVWITMWVGHAKNNDLHFLGAKFALSAVVVSVFTKTPGILETTFSILKAVARVDWDAMAWRSRVSLDMWNVYAGMIVAVAYVNSSDLKNSPHWQQMRKIAIGSSVLVILLFLLFEATQTDPFVYDAWHTCISFLPVIAFVVLRNASTKLRNTHSTAFAFIGRFSLETFILQFHIWLAADTKGILIVWPSSSRLANFVLGTMIFVFLSWDVANVTGTLTEWIMGAKIQVAAPASVPLAHIQPASLGGEMEDDEKSSVLPDSGHKQNCELQQNGGHKSSHERLQNGTNHEVDHMLLPAPVSSVRPLSLSEKLFRVIAIFLENLFVRVVVLVISLWLLNMVRLQHS